MASPAGWWTAPATTWLTSPAYSGACFLFRLIHSLSFASHQVLLLRRLGLVLFLPFLLHHSQRNSGQVTMIPATTPPAIDLSRSRLKGLTTWIRNELDPIVAREGPDVLRPDDVLTLHETFVSLRQSTRITALDLRATGMHRAIQDIAGVATRWPSRLCDDCDKIIGLWTARFGPFNKLHPFLYGRGGRLEGIASVADYTREVLLMYTAYVPLLNSLAGTAQALGRGLP